MWLHWIKQFFSRIATIRCMLEKWCFIVKTILLLLLFIFLFWKVGVRGLGSDAVHHSVKIEIILYVKGMTLFKHSLWLVHFLVSSQCLLISWSPDFLGLHSSVVYVDYDFLYWTNELGQHHSPSIICDSQSLINV